jgi:DNA-binding transcriptional LysR family regulator
MIEPHNSDPCSICSVTLDLLFIQPEEVAELAFFLSHPEAMRMLHEGRVQLALGFERPGLDERETFLEAGSQLLVAVAAPDHPAAAGKKSPLSEEQLVNVRQIIVATGGPADSDPRVVLSRRIWHSDNYLATLDLVQQGLGWAYLPKSLVHPLITSGALTEVVFDYMPSQMRLWVDIIWVKNRPLGLKRLGGGRRNGFAS